MDEEARPGGLGVRGVVTGQRVVPRKLERPRQFRRAMTRAESTLWAALRGGRLAGLHFRRQQVIDGLLADFYCHGARLVVEVDGSVHEARREYDAAREEVLAARGLRVLRLSNDDVLADLPSALQRILTAAVETSSDPLDARA